MAYSQCFQIRGNTPLLDLDNDGFGDPVDNCTLVTNSDQTDTDGDGFGNSCDGDFDNTNVADLNDYFTFLGMFGSTNALADFNHSGVVDLNDYFIFLGMFGQSSGPSGITP